MQTILGATGQIAVELARELCRTYVVEGKTDAIVFGRPFISNPDLPERISVEAKLTAHYRSTFYGGGREGNTDYPTLPQPVEAQTDHDRTRRPAIAGLLHGEYPS
ncbi:hypothetical protein [Stutzerimonas stutzeri]|uniref:hypothetical protein n=1 Tax=Stutzerimonas stutzeri TaxID=316 RepID=UPI001CFEE3E9|nr:hypothetical protein [Stutzerimonas stutzeri]